MNTAETLRNTPLCSTHIALGAKMVGFGGWNMPLQYEGILAEWDYNRKTCSIFDCSHMGEYYLKGGAAASGLDRIVSQPIADMPVKTCRYGFMLNPQGGVIDDLIVYRKGPDEWMIVVNAAGIEAKAAHIRSLLSKDADFTDGSLQTAKLDVQGPLSRDVLMPLVPDIQKLSYYTFDQFTLAGVSCLISRTGYTGELGYEIYCPADAALTVWKTILKDPRVRPTGLGVRDVLRVEMCYPLYGHELGDGISPLEAGMEKFIDWNKEFVGRTAAQDLKTKGVTRTVACIMSDSRRAPRAHQSIRLESGQVVGEVTSGTFSPGLQAGIGLGFVQKNENVLEKKIVFGDDKSVSAGRLVKRPFYKNGSLKN